MADADKLPEFEPEDPIPEHHINYINEDLQMRRLRREAIAMKGGETEGEKWIYSLLGLEMKILITDQRVLLGHFICTDRDRNVIMQGTNEFMSEEEIATKVGRSIGLAMIPGRHIQKMEIKQTEVLESPVDLSISGSNVTASQISRIEAIYEDNKANINKLSLMDEKS
jgi:hypothetical protein